MKSKFVRRPSAVRIAIIFEPTEQIPFKFQLWLPLGLNHCGNRHFFCEFFNFSLDPKLHPKLGAETYKRYSSLKSLLNPFKRFLNFLLSDLHKRTVLEF